MSEQKMKARVLVQGKFFDQVVDVIEVYTGKKQSKPTYRLATTWDGIPYPVWFDEDEIKIIKEDKQ